MGFKCNIDGGDYDLVIIKDNKPHCKVHGAMCRVSESGVYRCVGVYKKGEGAGQILDDNTCRAGCKVREHWMTHKMTPTTIRTVNTCLTCKWKYNKLPLMVTCIKHGHIISHNQVCDDYEDAP